MDTIGSRIKAQRTKLQLTQHELARAVDCQTQYVSFWERNARVPQTAVLVRLAEALHVTTDWLLGRQS